MKYPWILNSLDPDKTLCQDEITLVCTLLQEISTRTTFQIGFINFLAGLTADQSDITMVGKIFKKLDSEDTGYITSDSIKDSLAKTILDTGGVIVDDIDWDLIKWS